MYSKREMTNVVTAKKITINQSKLENINPNILQEENDNEGMLDLWLLNLEIM
jgi:hypothetical protein